MYFFNLSAFQEAHQTASNEGRRSSGRAITWLLAVATLSTLGCTVAAPGAAATAAAQTAETCEMRFRERLGEVVTYSKVEEGGSVRVDVCHGPEFYAKPFDAESIPLQIDEYAWIEDGWTLKASEVVAEACSYFTEGLNVGAAQLIEVLLCSDSVSPEEELRMFQKVSHSENHGCEVCFTGNHRALGLGSTVAYRWVYCQAPDWKNNKRVHADSYSADDFLSHRRTYTCPNILGLNNPGDIDLLCDNELPRRSGCAY